MLSILKKNIFHCILNADIVKFEKFFSLLHYLWVFLFAFFYITTKILDLQSLCLINILNQLP